MKDIIEILCKDIMVLSVFFYLLSITSVKVGYEFLYIIGFIIMIFGVLLIDGTGEKHESK